MLGRGKHATVITLTGYTGKLPKRLWDILERSWESGVAVSSNYAREWSGEIALAASMGWISTVALDGRSYHRMWHITAEGMAMFNHTPRERTA